MDSRFDGRGDRGDGGRLADDVYGAGPTPDCARVAPLLEAFYDDALDEAQSRWVAGHLNGCAFCAARMRRYAEIDRLVRAAPAPVAGPALRAGVYRAIATTQSAERMDTVATTAVAPRERRGRPNRTAEQSDPGWSQPGRSVPGNWRPAPPRGARAVWAGAVAVVCVIVAFAVIFAASRPPREPVAVAPTATATPHHALGILPAFHDWRAAYLDQVSGLHVVSLDGKSDTLITSLDRLSDFNSQTGVGVSPDGRYLAYIDGPKYGNIHVVDLAASTPVSQAQRIIQANARGLLWSPDGRWLLVSDLAAGAVEPGVYRVDPFTGAMTLISANMSLYSQVGWLDTDHLLIVMPEPKVPSSSLVPSAAPSTARTSGTASGTASLDSAARAHAGGRAMPLSSALSSGPYTYGVLDVAAGTVQAANGITVPAGWTLSVLLPGTTEALVEKGEPGAVCGAPCPGGTPVMTYALLDYSTGQITPTPKINGVASGNILNYATVDPTAGSGLFVATPNFTPSTITNLFLFDPVHDSARPLATGVFPEGWTPDGQTLLLGDQASLSSNTGAGALSILSVQAQQEKPTAIAQDMVTYLGLVRSA